MLKINSKFRKLLFLFTLIIIFSIAASIKLDDFIDRELPQSANTESVLIFGIDRDPDSIDPHQVYTGTSSSYIYDQVVEGLFGYNLSDPDLSLVPKLADDFGTWSGKNYTVNIRQNVYFHDGTLLNASAVKWNFDRLAYFMSYDVGDIKRYYEYFDPNEGAYKPIINRVEVVDTYTIRFVLNEVVATFEILLSEYGGYILSPSSTLANYVLDPNFDKLVGTGPFVYDYYVPETEINFYRNENYWAGPANISRLQFKIIEDAQARNNALLSGEVDLIVDPLSSMIDTFINDPNVTIQSTPGIDISFLGMDNNVIDSGFRKAISYAIDYDYISNEILDEENIRLRSPLPEAVYFSNWSYDVATYDVVKAREVMQAIGYGIGWDTAIGGINELDWRNAEFATYSYVYNIGSIIRENIYYLLKENLNVIGINLLEDAITWSEFLMRLIDNQGDLDLFWLSWDNNMIDPYFFINSFFTNQPPPPNELNWNLVNFNDPLVQSWMEAAFFTNNPLLRQDLYNNIQQRLVEQLYPWAYGFVDLNYVVYRNEISGFELNSLGKVSFYNVMGRQGELSLSEPLSYYPIHIYGWSDGPEFKDWGWAINYEWCSGSGTSEDPYVIENLIIDGSQHNYAINIQNSNAYFIIRNCEFINLDLNPNLFTAGIRLDRIQNGQIIQNELSSNYYGIFIYECSNITILYNEINNNFYGIGSIYYNHHIEIENNHFLENNYSISLEYNCSNHEIRSNIITDSLDYGLFVERDARDNLIYNNTFIGNTINAEDNGTNNEWDNGIIGNYWDDYIGPDNDFNGIGDIPYNISGEAYAVDYYPLMQPGIEIPDSEYPIIIDDTGNGDYTWKEAVDQPWCSGSGKFNNPYVIEDLIIEGADSGIIIKNSEVYFKIVNCTIINGGRDYEDAAIQLINVTFGEIIGNNCSNNQWHAISLIDCYNCTIFDNTLNSNQVGVAARSCYYLNIANNYIKPISTGIGLDNNCFNSIIKNNTIIGELSQVIGISLGGQNHILRNNNLENCGIIFFHFYGNIYDLTTYNIDTTNQINGKPIYCYINRNNLVPTDFSNAGQIILINSNNSTITDIDLSNSSVGLLLYGCNYNNFLNVNIRDEVYGLIMYQSSNNLIKNSVFSNSFYVGIYLYGNSIFNTFENNVISNNLHGMLVRNNSNTITANSFLNNAQFGLTTEYETQDNVIYNNSFIGNSINAQDGGINYWDNGIIGNYWDDYTGVDADDDGIGDTPYQLPDSISIDNFPIWDDGPGSPIPQYWILTPFIINDDGYGDYTWAEAVLEEWCSGSGTDLDPYIIKNVIIDSQGMDYGIWIQNSDVYFILRNCTIFNANDGIRFTNVINGIVELCNSYNNIANGISLDSCNNIVITSSSFNENQFAGIDLVNTNNSVISNNIVNRNQAGIYIFYSNNNLVSDNIAKHNQMCGIFVYGKWNQFSRNLMYGTGFFIWPQFLEFHSMINIDSSNLVDGKPIYFYRDMTGLDSTNFFNASQILLYNCSQSIISNLHLVNGSMGVYMVNCQNIIIQDNFIYRAIYGIQAVQCNNIDILNNTILENLQVGIYLGNTNYSTISRNKILYAAFSGIYFQEKSAYNEIINNEISYAYEGLVLSLFCTSNLIKDNHIHDCRTGIALYNATNNIIYLNQFENNENNAYESYYMNYWDNGTIGNYWDDYTGVDSNDDGIGDTPYLIPGYAGSVDNFPIWDDGPEPSGYWTLSPFIIDDDGFGDYTWTEVVLEEWCSGSGTAIDPYIIENVIIDGQGMDYGIWIQNSNVYFIIRNCTIFNAYDGIRFTFVNNGCIEESNISSNISNGITLNQCYNLIISNNEVYENYVAGIELINTNNSMIVNNKVNRNLQFGISTSESNDNIFLDNILKYNLMIGMYIHGKANQFSRNLMYGTGFAIWPDSLEFYSMENVPTSNLLDDKPIYYYRDMMGLNSMDFINASQIILFNCYDSEISDLTLINSSLGVYMIKCQNITIQDNFIFHATSGIYALECSKIDIFNNTILESFSMGIYLGNTNFSAISRNNILNAGYIGIWFQEKCTYNRISQNIILNASYSGIQFEQKCTYSEIINNEVGYAPYGLMIYSFSDFNEVKGNYIHNCFYTAILLSEAANNLIFLNYFEQNEINAYESSYTNYWDNGTIGNYWDDYAGVDANDDGIGDSPYQIDGDTNNVDNYPIWDDGPESSGYWTLSPFIIDDDGFGNYIWTEAVLEEWCSGSGTDMDPYIIENVIIDGQGMDYGIWIQNSDVYFILRNCTVFNATDGIRFTNVINGKVEFCNSYNNIANGISLDLCNNIIVINNSFNENQFAGIYLINTNNSVISNNYFNRNQAGIYIFYSNNNLVSDNIAKHNQMCGIFVYGKWNHFYRNLMYGTGFLIWPQFLEFHSMTDIDSSNLVDGKPIYFYRDMTGLDSTNFINASQILLYNCSQSIISNLYIVNGTFGVFMVNCQNMIVQNNLITQTMGGIYSMYCTNIEILDNNLLDCLDVVIFLGSTNYSTISGNFISNSSTKGIYLQENCIYNNIINNEITQAYEGIAIYYHCDFNVVENNYIHHCTEYGISLVHSSNNLIYLNQFENNGINAHESDYTNYWDNGTIGNYWDDYAGVDANDDGIGDTPYYIPGNTGSQDNYPIWDDGITIFPKITIISPTNSSTYGINSPTFQVSIIEDNLYSSWYILNDTYFEFFTGETGEISQSLWDLFPDGDLKITFWVNNTNGLTDWEYVIVRKDTTIPIITIIEPIDDELFSTSPPEYNIEIIEFELDSIWYTMNDGVNNITLTSYSGTLDGPIWDTLPDGSVIITFYANDTAGNIGSAQITVTKDTTAPIIIVNYPSDDQTFGTSPPGYEISIIENNLHTIWYTMDDGINNITIISCNGTLDEAVWDALPSGLVTIRFYASDTVGNIGFAQVIVIKKTSHYWTLSPFVIDDDGGGDYTWAEAVLEEWCSGSGTLLDPYIIANVAIDGQGMNYGVWIQNSDVYFILRNCTIFNAYHGIQLTNVDSGCIEECFLFNNNNGIYLHICNQIIIRDNNFSENQNSVSTYESNNLTISDNIINVSYNSGIAIFGNYSTIANNIISDSAFAGIYITGQFNVITSNLMYDCGLIITPNVIDTNIIDTSNLINGKPIYVYINENQLSSNDFINAGQIILSHCYDSIIQNLIFDKIPIAILLNDCNNITIRGNEINNTIAGIYLWKSDDNEISENIIFNTLQMGIALLESDNNKILHNEVVNSAYFALMAMNSSNNLVFGNSFFNNEYSGVALSNDSANNLVYKNYFIGNRINALDDGVENQWDNGLIGNYWDDYPGVDANDDGIGDTPYLINGTAGSMDYYPIFNVGTEFNLSTNADLPDDDGIFTLFWTEPEGVDSYSVYQHSSFITEITGDLVLLADEISDLSLHLEGYTDGTYYFIVVAHDEYGDTLSNCVQVNVELKLPPSIIQDTIPDEIIMSYTYESQIIGFLIATSTSQIISVSLIGEPDPGFYLDTTYTSDEDAGIYFSETTLKTTNQLESGVHSLSLRIHNADGLYCDKNFTVIVYRQAQLSLRGEFDYLLRERIKISIVAQALDIEGQFLLTPTLIDGMVVHIKIVDYDGNLKVEDTMICDADGVFHWDSVQTIRDLAEYFTEAIYIVQVWIEFPPDSYYLGGMDVIEFHIDPPGDESVDPWAILGITGFSGLIGINIVLTILLKRKRHIKKQ